MFPTTHVNVSQLIKPYSANTWSQNTESLTLSIITFFTPKATCLKTRSFCLFIGFPQTLTLKVHKAASFHRLCDKLERKRKSKVFPLHKKQTESRHILEKSYTAFYAHICKTTRITAISFHPLFFQFNPLSLLVEHGWEPIWRTVSCLDSSVGWVSGCETKVWEFDSPLCPSEEEPIHVAFSCIVPGCPLDGIGNLLLRTTYLENLKKESLLATYDLMADDDDDKIENEK